MGKIIYEGEDELVEPVRNLLTGGGVYDIQPEHDWFVVCLRLDGALTPSRERQWIIFGKKLDIEDYVDRRSVLRSMPQEIRDARDAAKQLSRAGAYVATTEDLMEKTETEALYAFAKELVDFTRAKVRVEFEKELDEIRAVCGFSADFDHASLLHYLRGLHENLAEEQRNREALYDENGRIREALGVELADLGATINAIYDAAGIKPRTARTLIRHLQGLGLQQQRPPPCDEQRLLDALIARGAPVQSTLDERGFARWANGDLIIDPGIVFTDEVKGLVYASARRAAPVFIDQMAKEWPDPDALLDGLWDDNVDDLCNDLDPLSAPNFAHVEALWRAEVKRIYEEGR